MQSLERQNLQNQTVSELYIDDNKSKYFNNPKNIFKSAIKFYEKLYMKETTSEFATTKILSKVPNTIPNTSLDDIIKSINSQTNNKYSMVTIAVQQNFINFTNNFSNELALVFVDVYDSWGKLGTMGVTSRTGIISVIYKKGDKKDIVNYKPT